MAEKFFHLVLGDDTAGDGTAANPYRSYDKARAMAGASDEVWGGGIGSVTWAKIRFCAGDGNDANSGLTPDSPKQSFWDVWNANDISTTDNSLIVLVKGSYHFTSTPVLSKGGRRSSSYCGTSKTLKGYSGSDYFGSGKLDLTHENCRLMNLDGCDNSFFRNLSIVDLSTVANACFGTVTAASSNVSFVDCLIDNASGNCFYFTGTPAVNYPKFMRCYVRGRKTAGNIGFSGAASLFITSCFAASLDIGINAGSAASGCAIQNTVINNCNTGGNVRYVPEFAWSNLILANCGYDLELGFSSSNRVLILENSIFYNCGELYRVYYGGLELENCCIHPALTGTSTYLVKSTGTSRDDRALLGSGCIVADPQFVDAGNGDFRLRSTSPCWNMGLTNPFIGENIAHIGAANRKSRGNASHGVIYANPGQVIRR